MSMDTNRGTHFRSRLAEPRSRESLIAQADQYVAFHPKDRCGRLRIRRANAPTRSPVYLSLLDVVYDEPFGTNFALVYSFLLVFVHGKNLQSIIIGLENGTVDFIQEFNARRWAAPQPDEPLIETIQVKKPDGNPVEESEQVTIARGGPLPDSASWATPGTVKR